MFLQSIGLLPDNIIILSTSRDMSEKSVTERLKKNFPQEKITAMTKDSVDQYDLNIKAVRSIFQGFFSEIDVENKTPDSTIEEIAVSTFFINYNIENIKIQKTHIRREKAPENSSCWSSM